MISMNKTKPVVTRKPWLSGIWLLPLVSALVGGWVLYQSMVEKGIEISILFNEAAGISAGKTQIMYKGVKIGMVREVEISKDLQQVHIIAEIQNTAKQALRKSTGLWLVKPTVSLTEITGLETIVSGNYIGINPGVGDAQREFIALENPPIIEDHGAGLYIDIFANHLGSVSRGSKIYFREIPVGEVLDYELVETESGVIIKVKIEQRYAHLVKNSSRFWNASGLSVKASLSGISVHTESLAALISGGIAFYTPDTETADLVDNGTRFQLHRDFDSAKVGIAVKITFESAVGLEEGVTEIKYDAFKIGIVKKLSYLKTGKDVIAEVVFDPRAKSLLNTGTQFWLDKPKLSLTDLSGLKSLLQGNHIKMQVGTGEEIREFTALSKPPLSLMGDKGLHLLLKAKSLSSIEYASPVLYKKIQVGQVHDFRLDDKGEYVLINIYITERYAHLVSSQSRFWNTSGINVKIGTAGLDIQTGTVDTILTGGIEFITPNLKHKKVKNGVSYPLYENYTVVMEHGFNIYKQAKNIQLISLKTAELGSLERGSKLYYKKIPVGKIVDYHLAKQQDNIMIKAEIDQQYQYLISSNTRFWRNSGLQVKADLSGVNVELASVHSLLNGGISFANTPFAASNTKNGYSLYSDKQHALQQAEDIQVKFALAEGISAGTAIKYLGIKVGEINRVELTDNNRSIIAYAQLINSATDFARLGTRFYRVSAELGLFKNKNLGT
ncbi:MAG: MCE family protein, partial [Methyloprofundus sp.]|nr:MCE family protein [Methyloprofundus sp.]